MQERYRKSVQSNVEWGKSMKRKYADRPNWSRIVEKSYTGIEIQEESFHGFLGYLSLDKIKEKLWVTYGAYRLCIVDDGYVWLQHFPLNGKFVLTTTFDDQGELVQGYFDIVKNVGITSEGIPYCDDLFLDVVCLPNGEIFTLDEDELLEAFKQNKITKDDYDIAHSVASELVKEIEQKRNYLLNSTRTYYKFIKAIREINQRRH
jgi:predicted RNA-binding protein associated with RNAse of E/G family